MTRRIILSPGARSDIQSSVRWYARKSIDHSFRFKVETRTTLRRIAQHPYAFPLVNALVRRALMKMFPYSIYFTVNEDSVFVIAVLHQRRAGTLWVDRSNGQTGRSS